LSGRFKAKVIELSRDCPLLEDGAGEREAGAGAEADDHGAVGDIGVVYDFRPNVRQRCGRHIPMFSQDESARRRLMGRQSKDFLRQIDNSWAAWMDGEDQTASLEGIHPRFQKKPIDKSRQLGRQQARNLARQGHREM
jgi:hypothetical protein